MNIQDSNEFKTYKFYYKTDFDKDESKKEEFEYTQFYKFKSKEEHERRRYKNFVLVGENVETMINELEQYKVMT